MTIEIRQVTASEMLENAADMFVEHWQEIALNKDVMTLKPHVERYLAMEALGDLIILAAYKDDELIGYSVNFLINHLHYADLRIASNDLLFIVKAHRQGRLGLALIRETEKVAKEKGAQMMLWHAKEGTTLQALMPRLGYGIQDIIFSKGL